MIVASYITGSETTEGDNLLFSRLLDALERGVYARVVNLMRYDGTWTASAESVPSGLTPRRRKQYERLLSMSRLNLARPIISAVESRQRPNGFRKVNDDTMRSTEANDTFMRNHLQLKTMQGNHDVALYGASYLLVADNGMGESIHYVDPWRAVTAENGESGIIYTYDDVAEVETVSFYRMALGEDGSVARVYKRDATRKHSRSVVLPDDKDDFANIIDGSPSTVWTKGSGFTWTDEVVEYEYARDCNSLPLLKRSSPDGMGMLQPHWATLDRINQKVFDQLVISMMQAFKQRAFKGIDRTYYTETDMEVISGQKQAGDPINFEGMFQSSPASLWVLPDNVDIWESGYVDIKPLDDAISSDIKRLASTAGIPLDVLSPDVQGSAEGASLKREGLTFLVEQLNMLTNDVMVRAITMALVLAGTAKPDVDLFEMMWLPASPQPMTDLANAASQLVNILPKKTIMKQVLGFTETQIQEALRDAVDENFSMSATGANLPDGGSTQAGASSPFAGIVDPSLEDNSGAGSRALNLTVASDGDTGGEEEQ